MRTAKTLIRLGGCQVDLSLHWVHIHFVGFVMAWLIYIVTPKTGFLMAWVIYRPPILS